MTKSCHFKLFLRDNLETPSDPEEEEKDKIISESYIKMVYDKRQCCQISVTESQHFSSKRFSLEDYLDFYRIQKRKT